jgi:hypothetical protein
MFPGQITSFQRLSFDARSRPIAPHLLPQYRPTEPAGASRLSSGRTSLLPRNKR